MEKAFQRIYWENKPSTETPIDANNLNRIEAGVDTIDDRVVALDTSQSGLTTRVTTAEGNITSLQNGKVDKVSGKGLSTNDYTTADKNKLAGISAQANRTTVTQVQESGDTSKEIAQIGLDGETTSIYADDAKKVIESCYEEKTVTGNPITVKTISGSNAKALKVIMNPTQDLHGYDHPWVGGAGKNMIDVNINTSVPSGQILFDTPITETVTISAKKNDVVISEAVWIIDILMSDNTHVYIGDTGYVNPFPQTINATPSKSIVKLTFRNYGITSGSYDIQMEYGSTATSYAPYSNICPISGRTEASVKRTGKNLAKSYSYSAGITSYDGNGNVTISGTVQSSSYVPSISTAITEGFFFTLPAGTYKPSTEKELPSGLAINVMTKNNQPISTGGSFTLAEETEVLLRIAISQAGTYNWTSGLMIEAGRTATAYEPYTSETHTKEFGQTVYGGTLDLTRGELTITDAKFNVNGTETGWSGDIPFSTNPYNRFVCTGIPSLGVTSNTEFEGITNLLIHTTSAQGINNGFRLRYVNNANRLDIFTDAFDSLSALQAYLANEPLQVCYELATPTIIQLSPEALTLLKGLNVISTDGDDMELTYQEIPDITSLANYVQTLEARIKALEEE